MASASTSSSSTAASKLSGREWYESVGSPRYAVAPMVDQSELAWRVLSRLYGATVCYTPMFHAGLFARDAKYRKDMFDDALEGDARLDRPLVVQFCANDKDRLLEAARLVAPHCDAVDLNLGCPQGIARSGHYGAFLMDEWHLIRELSPSLRLSVSLLSHSVLTPRAVSSLNEHLDVPVLAKCRIFPSHARTLEYATHLVDSGAQLVTVHGRTRDAKGRLAGLASWARIRDVVRHLKKDHNVPVLANGGVPGRPGELEACLEKTEADGIMSAEGNLYNPLLFNTVDPGRGQAYRAECLPEAVQRALDKVDESLELGGSESGEDALERGEPRAPGAPYLYAPAPFVARQYLAVVLSLETQTGFSAIKSHLFKLCRPIFAADKHTDMRSALGSNFAGKTWRDKVEQVEQWVLELERRIKADAAEGHLPKGSYRLYTPEQAARMLPQGKVPYSHVQPYLRVDEQDPAVLRALAAIENDELAHIISASMPSSSSEVAKRPASENGADESNKKAKAAGATLEDDLPPCKGHAGLSEPCVNRAASKCTHHACKACCAALSTGNDGDKCEWHAGKLQKLADKKAGKKARSAAAHEARKVKKQEARRAAQQSPPPPPPQPQAVNSEPLVAVD